MSIKEIEDAARIIIESFGTWTWENDGRKVIVKRNDDFTYNIQYKDGETLLNEFLKADIKRVAECLIVYIKEDNPLNYETEMESVVQRLHALRAKMEEVHKIGLKRKSDLTESESRSVKELDKMCDMEYSRLHLGDSIAYRFDDSSRVFVGTVIDILPLGSVRTDTDGIICSGNYVKIN